VAIIEAERCLKEQLPNIGLDHRLGSRPAAVGERGEERSEVWHGREAFLLTHHPRATRAGPEKPRVFRDGASLCRGRGLTYGADQLPRLAVVIDLIQR
jgi:hypothetical protein